MVLQKQAASLFGLETPDLEKSGDTLSLWNQVWVLWCRWKEKFQIHFHELQKVLHDQAPALLCLHAHWVPQCLLRFSIHSSLLFSVMSSTRPPLDSLAVILPVSEATLQQEQDSRSVQELGRFSHSHQLLQNSQGVYAVLFIFTVVNWVKSSTNCGSAPFSRYCRFSISIHYPNPCRSLRTIRHLLWFLPPLISTVNQLPSSAKFPSWFVLKSTHPLS